jgi:hypothetical protein
MATTAFDAAYRVARAQRLMINGRFAQGYRLIKHMEESEFVAALRLLAAQEEVFESIFQIRETYNAKESESTVSLLTRAAKAGDKKALSLLATGILEGVSMGSEK